MFHHVDFPQGVSVFCLFSNVLCGPSCQNMLLYVVFMFVMPVGR